MGNIREVHKEVLVAINEDGGRAGIAYYGRHVVEYEALQQQKAAEYWREIIDAVVAKERMTAPSLLAKKDPYLSTDSLTMLNADIRRARRYSQEWWRDDEHLDAKMANYIIETMDNALDLVSRIDEIPLTNSADLFL